jgi:integrase
MTTPDQLAFDFAIVTSPSTPTDDAMGALLTIPDTDPSKRLVRRARKSFVKVSDVPSRQFELPRADASEIAGQVISPQLEEVIAPAQRPANFAEALALVAASGVFTDAQLCKHRSHVTVAAKALQKVSRAPDIALLPCDPRMLRKALITFHPAQARIKKKQWQSILSGLRRILRATGWIQPRVRHRTRSPAWEALLSDIREPGQLDAIRRIANFCTETGVEPNEITDDTFALYTEHLERDFLTLSHRGVAVSARQTWRRVCRERPALGIPVLPRLTQYNLITTRRSELPASFHASVDAYLARCASPDPFDVDCGRALAAETLRKRSGYIFLGAQYLMDSGRLPDQLDHIRKICTPDAFSQIMREQFRRHSPDGKSWPAGAKPMASHFATMAQQIGDLPDADLAQLRKLASHIPKSKAGFPKKTRERLAVFDDERVLRDFVKLPAVLWQEAMDLARAGKVRPARAKARCAIALAILLAKPLRIGELVGVDFVRDFRRDPKGRIVSLYIGGERTKTGVPIEALIDSHLGKRISKYYEQFVRPITTSNNHFLFMSGSSGQISGNNMSSSLKLEIWRHLGIVFNSHLARGLVATIIMDSDPNGGPIAQRMLGHQHLHTTVAHYGMARGRAAQRQYEGFLWRALRGRNS